MNFFASILSDDPDPQTSDHESESSPSSPSSSNPTQKHQSSTEYDDGSDSNSTPSATSWSFGGLIKTLQVKSDWIDTYKRDLEEFKSGLKKETEVLKEVASRAVKDLPGSIDGAAKAQVSLESMGQAIDTIGSSVWKSTAEIISHGKESLLALDHDLNDVNDGNVYSGSSNNVQSVGSGRYSRFEAQLSAIQRDVNTYVDLPDDVDDYNEWKSGFKLEGKSEEIEGLMQDNGSIEGIYKRVVPDSVDHDEFWFRYYYRVHRLTQAENVRAKLVKRAISTEDEEELSWDVDDDEEEEEVKKVVDGPVGNVSSTLKEEHNEESKNGLGDQESVASSSVSADKKAEMEDKVEVEDKSNVVQSASEEVSNKELQSEETSKVLDDELSKKSVGSEGKAEPSESGKESDISVVSTQPSHEEDDMGWDEIEDIGSEDEKKVSQSDSPNRAELRKRLSAAEDDEDLSWDIEDDD